MDEIQWKSPEWIQHFGLRSDNVLEYFAESPFYDRTSNNQVVKMQHQFQAEGQVLSSEFIQQEVMRMRGVEFVVVHTKEPDFWVIRKQNRLSPTEAQPLDDFYIVGANVYMAPRISDVVSSRLLTTSLALKQALGAASQLTQYAPADGHTYRQSVPPAPAQGPAQGPAQPPAQHETPSQVTDNLLGVSLRATPHYID